MLWRFTTVLGRFSASPSRGFLLQNSRALGSSPVLRSNGADETPAPSNKRGGLTGFLYEKTGVTGAWTLGVGVGAYLISKELYVLNSETVTAAVIGGVVYWLVKTVGPQTAEYLDNRSQQIFNLLNESKVKKIENLEKALQDENSVEQTLEARHEMFEILKENNAIRMEEEYRRRLSEVTNAVKKRLDYQVDVDKVQKKFQQQQLVQWLEKEVTQTVEQKQDESLAQCMTELKKMATT